jgi:hypothetical protein
MIDGFSLTFTPNVDCFSFIKAKLNLRYITPAMPIYFRLVITDNEHQDRAIDSATFESDNSSNGTVNILMSCDIPMVRGVTYTVKAMYRISSFEPDTYPTVGYDKFYLNIDQDYEYLLAPTYTAALVYGKIRTEVVLNTITDSVSTLRLSAIPLNY